MGGGEGESKAAMASPQGQRSSLEAARSLFLLGAERRAEMSVCGVCVCVCTRANDLAIIKELGEGRRGIAVEGNEL